MSKWILHKLKGDKVIWLVVILLMLVSLLAIYSSSTSYAVRHADHDREMPLIRHAIFLLLGMGIIFAVHLVNYRVFAQIANLLLFITIPLMIFTITQGRVYNESASWISIMGFSFQPSDFAKLTLIIFLAKLLAVKQDVIKNFNEGFLPALFWVTILCGLIAPADLGTSAVMFVAALMIMFIGGIDFKHIGLLFATACIALVFLFNTADRAGTWINRVDDYWAGMTDESHISNAQTVQANIAIASGGLFGKGIGKSTQRNFLPEAYADYVYAIVIEEYGLVGATVLLLLYLTLLFRTVSIATASKTFGALLASGLAFLLVLQAMTNMAVNVGLLPVTGLTLPMVSMGGSSIIMTSIMLGIILSVSKEVVGSKQSKKELKRQMELAI